MPEPASGGGVRLRDWAGFIAMSIGMFLAILDIQIVASSLPTIEDALDIGDTQISWVQTAYLIAEIVAIPLTGWLTAVTSTRWLFAGAMLGFVAASAGCAASTDFHQLIGFRLLQGFCGGAVIPIVFSSAFRLFDERRQLTATTIAGVLAMLAPTLGPVLGGKITETYSWHWLFLINLLPGLVVVGLVVRLVDIDRPDWGRARTLDLPSLLTLAGFLGGLEILLKEAPHRGWLAPSMLGLTVAVLALGAAFLFRSLKLKAPLVDLGCFAICGTFALSCWYSFVLGMGLYGSIYLMPLFLGLVRGKGPTDIGIVMTVTGATQLVMAPIAAMLERRLDGRWVMACGYALFAAGLGASAFQTVNTDFDQMVIPQIMRGAALMLCILPAATLALGNLPPDRVANGSGLFNLMRNLGGAIGIALIDTVLEHRAPIHAAAIADRLKGGDADFAVSIGIPRHEFLSHLGKPVDDSTQDLVRPLIEHAAATQAFNECWMLLAVLTLISLAAMPLLRRPQGVGVRGMGGH